MPFFVVITNKDGAQIIEAMKFVDGHASLIFFPITGSRLEIARNDVLTLVEAKDRKHGEEHLQELGF